MSSKAFDRGSSSADAAPAKRRSLLLGAGVAGAAVLAAKALPVSVPPAVPADKKPAADEPGGYQLTQHVLRYYETTKV